MSFSKLLGYDLNLVLGPFLFLKEACTQLRISKKSNFQLQSAQLDGDVLLLSPLEAEIELVEVLLASGEHECVYLGSARVSTC